MVSDKTGASQALNPMFSYAYRIANTQKWELSMGLSGGTYSRITDGSLFEAETDHDTSFTYEQYRILKPDANAGVEFQTLYFVMGLSSTHLISIFNTNPDLINSNHRYSYFIYRNNQNILFNYNFGFQIVNRQSLTIFEGNAGIRIKNQPAF